MGIKLVEDWRKAHKWATTRIAAAVSIVALAYDYLPAVQTYVAPYVSPKLMAGIAAAIIVARVTDFGKKP